MRKILTLLIASLALLGCKDNKNSKILGDQKAGESLTGWYYYHLSKSQFDSIPSLLSADDFNEQQKNQLVSAIKDRQDQNGPIKSFNLKKWDQTDSNKKEKTKDFVFEYEVNYEKKSVVEKIYLEKKGNILKISSIDFD
ncbi:hypothetical protein ACYSNM_03905 [Myroides sp. LJL116]